MKRRRKRRKNKQNFHRMTWHWARSEWLFSHLRSFCMFKTVDSDGSSAVAHEYDSESNMNGGEFLSSHRMFTQKSTLIFVQIEIPQFFFPSSSSVVCTSIARSYTLFGLRAAFMWLLVSMEWRKIIGKCDDSQTTQHLGRFKCHHMRHTDTMVVDMVFIEKFLAYSVGEGRAARDG